MSVGEICNRNVVFIYREGSIREAALLMRKHHVGDVVVVEKKEEELIPIGILTDRDIVLELTAEDVDLNSVTVGDVMSFELVVAREEDDVLDTIKKMRSKGIRRIPIVNNHNGLEGILTVDDLIELLSEQLMDLTQIIAGGQDKEYQKRP
ncbi:CBS domain-containing protein [Desulfosediminicola flagellatus]|uniref:CBS domain-containing protein n=1 Tax=Desulfosediminicola flagellatus TaxID=2569541 RepID=UPI0010AD564A|nr:CBS domain-containing protein [Desulfosediminicola flagellatus]